ncbi:hypothetical protein ACGF7W_23470 [Streptomyces sp. NPDC048219]|uniref:hypothetical protein n=1 Tax=Streptomyces sp. NPDC048219 TaxID=3365517 RepID=UPI0037228F51
MSRRAGGVPRRRPLRTAGPHRRLGRRCLNTAGPHNIVLDVWLRALSEITSFESRMVRMLPHFRIADRNVVLRTVKRIGRLIDERGRAVGTTPTV